VQPLILRSQRRADHSSRVVLSTVCVVVCDLETSWMRSPGPLWAVAPKLGKQTKSSRYCSRAKLWRRHAFHFGGRKRSYRNWWMGLLVVVKWRGVYVYCLKLQCDKLNCTYWGGQQNKAKHDAVVVQVTRSSPKILKFHWPNAVHCTMTRSVVKGSCFYVVDAARHLQQLISRGTYSSLQPALSTTTQWRNDCELVPVYMTLFT